MHTTDDSPAATGAGLRIVLGLELTDRDGPAFDRSLQIAQRASYCELHLIHVFDGTPDASRGQETLGRLRRHVKERARAVERPQGITVGIHLRWGDVAAEIAQLAADVRADFIVLGSNDGAPLERPDHDSVAARLNAAANCPVLAVGEAAERLPDPSERQRRVARELEGGATGAFAGAIVGAAAGPPGALAGALLGGLAGAMAGVVLDRESLQHSAHERELDTEVGVFGGDLGAPRMARPVGAERAARVPSVR